jgi:hypothetical protein
MEKLNSGQTGIDRPPVTAQGCSLFMLLLLSSFWVLGGTALALIFTWGIEQAILEGSFALNDIRWIVMLAYGGILTVALLIVSLWTRVSRMKAVFRTWMLAAILALVLAPARMLPIFDTQLTMLFQIGGLLFFILGLWLLLVRPTAGMVDTRFQRSDWRGSGLALLVGAVIGLPWVRIGAFGSPLDTLLALIVAGLFGIAGSLLLTYSLHRNIMEEKPEYTSVDYGMDGFAAMMTLLILVTSLGQNNIQWVLALTVPAVGWAVVGVAMHARATQPSTNWPSTAIIIAMAVGWPLMMVDPLELAAVVTGTPGELIGWIAQAGLYSLLLGLLAGIIIGLLLRRIMLAPARSVIMMIPIGLAALGLAVVYFLWGQPGFHGDRLFVVLAQQADLTQASTIDDPQERRQYVYDLLVEHATVTQSDLRAELDRFNIRYTPFYLENGLEVHADSLFGFWFAGREDVDRVLRNPRLRPLPTPIPQSRGNESRGNLGQPVQVTWNLERINAPQVWEMGVRGQGIVIGHSDSGVQHDHPELAESYRGSSEGHNYHWHDAWFNLAEPYDRGGHGTHTLAIVVGKQTGVAPDAQWIGCSNMARNFGNPAYYLECWQFLFAPYPHGGDPLRDGQPKRGAHILNNSWGCPLIEGCDPYVLAPALAALRSAGVFTVVSAGNSGMAGCETVRHPPALHADAFSVGAIDVNNRLAFFSSVGPVAIDGSGRLKPQIVAPGVDVLSAFPGSSYMMLDGTSMAAPHVTGTVTLMWSANPALIGKIDRTIEILSQTASPYTGDYPECIVDASLPNPAVGYGVLDAAAAVRMALDE